jgi:hypothetical protein
MTLFQKIIAPYSIKSYFCRLIQNVKKMKKIIVFGILLLGSVLVFSACDTQKRCAAYGHYSYVMPSDNPDNIN